MKTESKNRDNDIESPKSAPLVSICIPCYKNPDSFERCLVSVMEQTYSNFEVLITDDSPTNEIKELVELHFKDERVFYQKNLIQLGSPENWNAGIALAKGEFIKILHHDDWFAQNDALAKFVDKALSTNADFICSNCVNNLPDKKRKHKILDRFKAKWSKDNSLILFSNLIGAPSVTFYKRQLRNPVLFDRDTFWFVDILFYFDYVSANKRIEFIDDFLINITAGSETQVTNSMVNAKIVMRELINIGQRLDLTHNQKSRLLYRVTMLEKMSKYKIRNLTELATYMNGSLPLDAPFYFLRLPLPYRFYSVLKHIIMLF